LPLCSVHPQRLCERHIQPAANPSLILPRTNKRTNKQQNRKCHEQIDCAGWRWLSLAVAGRRAPPGWKCSPSALINPAPRSSPCLAHSDSQIVHAETRGSVPYGYCCASCCVQAAYPTRKAVPQPIASWRLASRSTSAADLARPSKGAHYTTADLPNSQPLHTQPHLSKLMSYNNEYPGNPYASPRPTYGNRIAHDVVENVPRQYPPMVEEQPARSRLDRMRADLEARRARNHDYMVQLAAAEAEEAAMENRAPAPSPFVTNPALRATLVSPHTSESQAVANVLPVHQRVRATSPARHRPHACKHAIVTNQRIPSPNRIKPIRSSSNRILDAGLRASWCVLSHGRIRSAPRTLSLASAGLRVARPGCIRSRRLPASI
jgi:hypothetical protein